jgi:hypothetical protein
MMEAISSSGTSVLTKARRCNILADGILYHGIVIFFTENEKFVHPDGILHGLSASIYYVLW